MTSRVFQSKFRQIRRISVSSHFVHALHIHNVAGMRWPANFTSIKSKFWRVYVVWLNFVHGPSVKELQCSAQGPFCSVYLFSVTLLKRFTFPWNLFAHNHWSEKNSSQETMPFGFDEKTFDSLKSLVRKWPVRNWQSLWQTATPVD